MKFNKFLLIFLLFSFICLGFFYKTLLYGYILFPGDLLISEYNPWKTYSYLGYNPGSFPHKAQYFDVLRQIYPWKSFSISIVRDGLLPLWNPHNFSGAPLLANFQSAVFYPLGLLYLLFPQVMAWTVSVMLQPFFCALFTYFYVRKIGVSAIGGLFAAFSFAFSSFAIVWIGYNTIGHVILWLPLVLLCIEHLLNKRSLLWSFIFVFALVSSLFAGHIQIFAYLLIFTVAYAVWRFGSLKRLKPVILLMLMAIGIGSVQIFPGIELLKESARVDIPYEFMINKILIQPWQLVMFFVPDFFGNPATHNYWLKDTYVGKMISIGIIPLFFILFSLRSKGNPFIRFFTLVSGAVFLLITLNPITIALYGFSLPVISASSPTLAAFLLVFSLSVLAGFGVDCWQTQKYSLKSYVKIFSPLLFIFIILWLSVLFMHQSELFAMHANIAFRNLAYTTIILLFTFFCLSLAAYSKYIKLKYNILVILFLLHLVVIWRAFDKFNPFVPTETVFPEVPVLTQLKKIADIDRFWGYGAASIEANFATQYKLFSPEGYDPLYPKGYGSFIYSSQNGKIQTQFTVRTRSDAVVAPGFGKEDLMNNPYRLKILDMLGVRYVLDRVENGSTEETFPNDRFAMVYEENGWKIYENKKALPRAFLASDYRVFSSEKEFEKIFFSPLFDPSKTILLEEKLPYNYRNSTYSGKLTVKSYTPNDIFIETESETNQLLFLSDIFYPGWKAYVDGNETKIYRANYTFRAVHVPKDSHIIRFTLNPSSFKIGTAVSILSFFITIIFVLNNRNHKKGELA